MKMKSLITIALSSTILLAGCSPEEVKEKGEKLSETNRHYPLVYAEAVSDGMETVEYEIAYKNNSQVKYRRVDDSNFIEHILSQPEEKPYIVIDKNDYHVYRQPYVIYNSEDDFEGTVTDKEVTK